MTKAILFFVALFVATTAYGQGTCTTANVCNCVMGGVLNGTITIANNTTLNLTSTTCGASLTLGTVTFNFATANSALNIGDNVIITSGTDIAFTGNQGMASATVGGNVFTANGSGGTGFGDLADILESCTNPSGCTVGITFPVTLLSWTARPAAGAVVLEWTTTEEVDNDFYSIEHSLDGRNFSEMTRIPGSAKSSATLNYRYVHAKPVGGTHYYRLNQQDLDGTRTTFEVVSVTLNATDALSVFPNPVVAGATLRFSVGQHELATEARLLDRTGRTVATTPLGAAGTTELNLPTHLPAGLYLLRVGQAAQRIMVRR